MVYSLTQELQSLGVPAEMGKELQRQIDANSFSAQHLMYAGWATELAQYLASSLSSGTFKASVVTELSMIPEVASLIEGGGVPAGFSLWKTGIQTWRFDTQRAISPART